MTQTILQERVVDALTALQKLLVGQMPKQLPTVADVKQLIKEVKAATLMEPAEPRYKCPECDTLLDEGERRCGDCNKFGTRVDFLMMCPHCDEPITGEEQL